MFDNFEKLLLEASKREGERPSASNLPETGEIMRIRTDENTGTKYNEFFARRSFIADLGREGPLGCFKDHEPEDRRCFIWLQRFPGALVNRSCHHG